MINIEYLEKTAKNNSQIFNDSMNMALDTHYKDWFSKENEADFRKKIGIPKATYVRPLRYLGLKEVPDWKERLHDIGINDYYELEDAMESGTIPNINFSDYFETGRYYKTK